MAEEKKKLNDTEVDVITLIEQMFWETGKLPTNEVVAERLVLNIKQVENCWKTDIFRHALLARGISLSPEKNAANLTPQQLLVTNAMLNVIDKRSVRQKLDEFGVTPQQYQAWLRQDAFQSYLKMRAEEVFKAADSNAFLGLVKAVDDGDVNALKLFFEMRGIYNPKLQVDVNIEGILLRVVEVVSKHVSPEVLDQIADELEGITGNTVSLAKQRAIPVSSSLAGL